MSRIRKIRDIFLEWDSVSFLTVMKIYEDILRKSQKTSTINRALLILWQTSKNYLN